MNSDIPERMLLGPGPSPVPQRVLQALSSPVLGHLDPAFLIIMDETRDLLRQAFMTTNEMTIPISGTGSAGMEACVVNTLEPGDRLVVGVAGYFGERLAEIARRAGADVTEVSAEWGRVVDPERLEVVVRRVRPQAVAVVHVETSTGVLQPIPPIADIAHRYEALLIVDAVSSLGGVELRVDDWGVDLCYSGSQKCLNAPPGLAPLTAGKRLRDRLGSRKTKVQSWYLDLSLLSTYWGATRLYHHTAPVSMIYALREGLRIVQEEGLERRWERHQRNAELLREGLEALGLHQFAQEGDRAPTVITVRVPDGVDELDTRQRLLTEFGIEIGGGLGPTKGRLLRIGLMGAGSSERNVLTLLAGLSSVFDRDKSVRPVPPACVQVPTHEC